MIKIHNKSLIYLGLALLVIMLVALPGLAERRGSIFQMAGNVQVEEDEIVDGNVDAMAGNITIYGTVNGNVTAMAGNITIHGTVEGDVRATAGNIYVRKGGKVTGDATAMAGKVQKDEGAIVEGSVVELVNGSVHTNDYNFGHWGSDVYISPKIPWLILIWGTVTGLISWLALGALLMLFFAKQVQRVGEAAVRRPGYYFLIGLIAYLLVPPVMILMAITIVGIPAAFVLVIVVFLGTIGGQLGIARFFGQKLIERFNWQFKTEMSTVLIGILVLFLITLIPVLGWLFFFVTACIGFGSAVLNRFGIEKKEEE